MRLLICGDRNWYESSHVFDAVRWHLNNSKLEVVISGGARGADRFAEFAAHTLGVECEVYEAEWVKFGKAAGPKRNQRMLDEGKPDLVLAFHDDLEHSKGTLDMVRRARKAGVPVKLLTSKSEEYC